MQVQVDIKFEELIKLVKELPQGKLKQLKAIIEKETKADKINADLEAILLKGPVATKNQLEIIENNRKAINQWRTK